MTLLVSNEEQSNSVKEEQPLNILEILVDSLVLKFFKFILVKFEQSLKRASNLSTFTVLNSFTSILVKNIQYGKYV